MNYEQRTMDYEQRYRNTQYSYFIIYYSKTC